MARILVTEKIADTGLARLRDAGHEVVIREGLSADGLLDEIAVANALIIRSATQVTDEVLSRTAWSSSVAPASALTTSTSRRRRAAG